MKYGKVDQESDPADDGVVVGFDIEAQLRTASQESLDTDDNRNSPSTRLFNSLLRLLNMRAYKYSFNVLLSCITIIECAIFIVESNNWDINVYALRLLCCVGIQITGLFVTLILLYSLSTSQDRRVLKACLLDTMVWIVASTFSILSLQEVPTYITTSTILVLTLRFLSHNSFRCEASKYLVSAGKSGRPKLLPTFLNAFRPFMTESFGLSIILILSSCWIAISSTLVSYFEGVLLNVAISKDSTFGVYLGALLLVIASIPLSYMLQSWLLGYIAGKTLARMQRKILDKVCFGNNTFVENHTPGKLANTFSGSLKQLYLLWDQNLITRILIPGINVVVVIVFIGTVNIAFMLFCLASIPIFFSITPVQTKSMQASKQMTEAFAVSQSIFENVVSLRKAIKASATVTPFLEKTFNGAADGIARGVVLARTWAGIIGFLYSGFSTILAMISIWLFYSGLYDGKYTAGQVVQVVGYIQNFVHVISAFGRGVQYVAGGAGDIQDLFEILDNEDMENRTQGTSLKPVSSEIILKNIKKECPGLSRPILDIDHLSIKAGSMCSILGSSGAGKSTLLHCLARSIPYDSGDVYFDDQKVSETSLDSYREQVAVVFQETMVLNGTIAENIAFGRDITQVAIEKAAQRAEIHDFIKSLPEGYSTKIGKDSPTNNLSGGQLQRIAGLARAFAGCPKVLLLDEATSALDPESERSIFKTLVSMKGRMTIISVTHRHETAMSSDLVIVLESGKILKSGKYNQLFKAQVSNE